jgi:small subunit ribosomal protein S16
MTRKGTSKVAFFRIVVTPSRSPRDGRFLEQLGWYDPQAKPAKVKLNLERYKHWVKLGAVPSETVGQIAKRYEKALKAEAEGKTKVEKKPEPKPAKK